MEETKQEAKFYLGVYLGREFKSKGTTQAGKEWTKYKVKFKQTQENGFEKETNFWTFNSAKGFSELQEGEFYNVGYNENPGEFEGKPIVYKSAFYFGKPKIDLKKLTPAPVTKEIKEIKQPVKVPVLPERSSVSVAMDTNSPIQPIEKMVNKTYNSILNRDATLEDREYHYIGYYLSMISDAIVERARIRYQELFAPEDVVPEVSEEPTDFDKV